MTRAGDPPDDPLHAVPDGSATSRGAPAGDAADAPRREAQLQADAPEADDDRAALANVVRVDFKRPQRTSPSDPTAPQKHAVFSRFIQKGKVMVTLDARRVGVTVPRQFASEPQLNLDFSERFGLVDFVYDERGVRASLSFNRQPFFCDVPWAAVYALYSHVDNERLTWARSLPADIVEQLPDASVEHLERVLEMQVERLLRVAREQSERGAPVRPAIVQLDAADDGRGDRAEALPQDAHVEARADGHEHARPDARSGDAVTPAADAQRVTTPDADTLPPGPPTPTTPSGRPGLRLVKR